MAEKEYIERGAVLRHIFDQIEEHGDPDPIDSPVARGSLMGLKYAHAIVSTLPAADVVEVVHASWDKDGRCMNCGGHAPYIPVSLAYHKSHYCFECGTKMDGGKTE